MSKKRPYFQKRDLCSSKSRKRHGSDLSDRVQLLDESTIVSVRAGQQIGSLPRAIEELVRNSILHGKAKFVDITIGTTKMKPIGGTVNYIEVFDDGIGIDIESTRCLIGTEHCTSQPYRSSQDDTSGNSDENYKTGIKHKIHTGPALRSQDDDDANVSIRGESLKALAVLCIEMHVATASSIKRSSCTRTQGGTQGYVKSKSNSNDGKEDYSNLVSSCEKVIQNGVMASFKISSSTIDTCCSSEIVPSYTPYSIASKRDIKQPNIENTSLLWSATSSMHRVKPFSTGTIVKLYGLFHRHSVRRRHYEMRLKSSRPTNTDDSIVGMAQARGCIQLLAMAFPKIVIRLFRVGSTVPDTAWNHGMQTPIQPQLNSLEIHNMNAENFLLPPYFLTTTQRCAEQNMIASNTEALRFRLNQLCGIDIMEQVSTTNYVFYVEKGVTYQDKDTLTHFQTPQKKSILRGNNMKIEELRLSRSGDSEYSLLRPNGDMSTNRNSWTVSGLLCHRFKKNVVEVSNRIRQHELIFINGRLSRNHASLADIVQSVCSSYSK